MQVEQKKLVSSALDSYVYVYNSNGALIGSNDDYGGTLNSRGDG